MRLVSLVTQGIQKTRRAISQPASLPDADLKDPAKLAEQIRQLQLRLNKLEAASQGEPVEFEVNCPDSGGTVTLNHGFKSAAVRWTVVGWFSGNTGKSPVAGPSLAYDTSSTTTALTLRSWVKGRAIVRVEPAQGFVDPATRDTLLTPQGVLESGKLTFNDIVIHTLITVPVPDNSACVWRVTVIGQDTTTLANRAILTWDMHARRQGGGSVTDLVNVVQLATATTNYSATASISGTSIIVTGQKLVTASPVTWVAKVEPVLTYLRDE